MSSRESSRLSSSTVVSSLAGTNHPPRLHPGSTPSPAPQKKRSSLSQIHVAPPRLFLKGIEEEGAEEKERKRGFVGEVLDASIVSSVKGLRICEDEASEDEDGGSESDDSVSTDSEESLGSWASRSGVSPSSSHSKRVAFAASAKGSSKGGTGETETFVTGVCLLHRQFLWTTEPLISEKAQHHLSASIPVCSDLHGVGVGFWVVGLRSLSAAAQRQTGPLVSFSESEYQTSRTLQQAALASQQIRASAASREILHARGEATALVSPGTTTSKGSSSHGHHHPPHLSQPHHSPPPHHHPIHLHPTPSATQALSPSLSSGSLTSTSSQPNGHLAPQQRWGLSPGGCGPAPPAL
ncbi:hypothetical protein HDU67_007613, partial [Dinochytrium kinnereticum]